MGRGSGTDVWQHPTLRTALLITAIATTFCTNFIVLLPLYMSHTFQQDAAVYGLLMSCLGIGMVVGSLMAASWPAPTLRRVAGRVGEPVYPQDEPIKPAY